MSIVKKPREIFLAQLKNLYMQAQSKQGHMLDAELGITYNAWYRFQFSFTYNNIEADSLVFFDQSPYIIAIAAKDTNYYFEFTVSKDFTVSSWIEPETYSDMKKAFKIKYDPNHTFLPRDFWSFYITKIPKCLNDTISITARTMVMYYPYIEEINKLNFNALIIHEKCVNVKRCYS